MARKDVDRGNRFEGLIEQDLANDDFELVSFTAAFEPFSGDAQLRVRFFLPAPASVRIVAQDLDSQWNTGWNRSRPSGLSGAGTRRTLAERRRHRSPPDSWSDLGVVVHLDDNIYASGPVAPAFVYHTRLRRPSPSMGSRFAAD